MDRRIKRLTVIDAQGCWRWQGRTMPHEGYGVLSTREDGKTHTHLAHRVAYETFVGPISDGLQLDHLCRVRDCVNPAHLEPVTPRENVMRSPIAQAALNAAKTHCPQGHPYDEANTYRTPRGRVCRACAREQQRRYRERKAA